MTNEQKALDIAIKYLESENIICGTKELSNRITKWENKFDPIDPYSLASLAIANPLESNLTKSEVRHIKEFFFPSDNYIESIF